MKTVKLPTYSAGFLFGIARLLFIVSLALLAMCCFIIFIRLALLIIIALALLAVARLRGRRPSDNWSFGTARFAEFREMLRAGMVGGNRGMILGRDPKASRRPDRRDVFNVLSPRLSAKDACLDLMRALLPKMRTGNHSSLIRMPPSTVHTAIFASTGQGKGTSCSIPFLLTDPSNAIVIDYKGEHVRACAEARRRMGHKVVVIDPYRTVTDRPDTFNPLSLIKKDAPDALDLCRDLAGALVVRTGKEAEPHWVDSASNWISALLALVVLYADPSDRSLVTIRKLLSDPAKLEQAVKVMRASPEWQGILARLGGNLAHYRDKELASTLTTSGRFVHFLDTPAISESVEQTSFDLSELVRGRMTIFLVIPPHHASTTIPLVRVWISSILREIVRQGGSRNGPIHAILDEASALGPLDIIDEAIDRYRSYGIRLQFYFQSIGQLAKCFPHDNGQTLLSNTTKTFFAVSDYQTSETVSNMLGDQTITLESGGTSYSTSSQSSSQGQGGSHSTSTSTNSNWNFHGRRLLTPAEVMQLHPRTAITFATGIRPICSWLLRHYEEPQLLRMAAETPASDDLTLAYAALRYAVIWTLVSAATFALLCNK